MGGALSDRAAAGYEHVGEAVESTSDVGNCPPVAVRLTALQ